VRKSRTVMNFTGHLFFWKGATLSPICQQMLGNQKVSPQGESNSIRRPLSPSERIFLAISRDLADRVAQSTMRA
jgi:hypothetical protein